MTSSKNACFLSAVLLFASIIPISVCAQESASAIYQQLKVFDLAGGSAPANNVVLKRDRVTMNFTSGTFYFAGPVAGKVRGAVFIGEGTFRAEVPPNQFEREFVQRLLKADAVESDFKTAVLQFSDDSFDILGKATAPGTAPSEAQRLATEFGQKLMKESGVNVAARLAISILNNETPPFHVAQFDKGKRKRFTYLLDHQGRIPTTHFGIDGGEKGLIFAYRDALGGNDNWMAFYSEEDYKNRQVNYSDMNELVDAEHYEMKVDLTDPGKRLMLTVRMNLVSRFNDVRAIPFAISESLSDYDNDRLKRGMKLKSAKMGDGTPVEGIQEDWEGGFTIYLLQSLKRGEKVAIEVEVAGDYLFENRGLPHCYYLLSNSEWWPRHSSSDRATFDILFHHKKGFLVAGTGKRVKEGALESDPNTRITQWKMDVPIRNVAFGLGRFERHEEVATQGDQKVPIEFYSLPGDVLAIKEDFMSAEMMNSLNYFTVMFGTYPYPKFGAVFHPRGFGQGFASLLLIPNTDRASKYVYSFIAHETAHQWWGNIISWRSYRDQWLSEGFAEYSGVLYTGLRDKSKSARDLVDDMRRTLKDPPVTETGIGQGRLVDVGPIILGHRLSTRETFGAYQALIYNKGGLVLRMLHFLFSDPATGNGDRFFAMMTDFVKRYGGGWATTEEFVQVANEHFAKTPVAQKYGLKDLNWFFRQWVYQAHFPSYRMEYQTDAQPDGTFTIQGVIYQDNTPEDWFMPLPLVFEFDKNQVAMGTVHAYGPKTPFNIKLPMRPKKVELDPNMWVISEKTSTRGK